MYHQSQLLSSLLIIRLKIFIKTQLKLLAAQLSGNQSYVLATLKQICDIYDTTQDFTVNQLNGKTNFENINNLLNRINSDGSYQIPAKFIGFQHFQLQEKPSQQVQVSQSQIIFDMLNQKNEQEKDTEEQFDQLQDIDEEELEQERQNDQKMKKAQQLINNGQYQDATQILQQIKPNYPGMLHLFFLCLKRLRQYEEIVNLSLIYKDYLQVDDLALYAYSLAKIDKLEEAVEIYNECEKKYNPVPISTLFNKALCLFRLGDIQQANNYVQMVLEIDPNMQEAQQLQYQILKSQ